MYVLCGRSMAPLWPHYGPAMAHRYESTRRRIEPWVGEMVLPAGKWLRCRSECTSMRMKAYATRRPSEAHPLLSRGPPEAEPRGTRGPPEAEPWGTRGEAEGA